MKKNKITLSVVAALALGASANTLAAGFQLAEYSATGLGRAFAGEAAMADNASTQFRNPAMLTYLEGTQISTGAIYVDPNIDVKGNIDVLGKPLTSTKAGDIAHGAVIPNFYLSHRVNEQWAVGLAFATNYGLETELGGNFAGTMFGDKASVFSVEINPNVAYKINDQFSIGGGVRFVMGEGHIGASVPSNLPAQITGDKFTDFVINSVKGQDLKYMEGEDTAWGWQLGGAWQINDNNRIGFNYRSEVNLDLEGEASGVLYGKESRPGSMALTLPATAELASFHQLTDKLAMHASINWTDWSTFDKLEAKIPGYGETGTDLIKEENWEDNYRFAVGATYQYTSKLALRTGVAYDTSAVSDEHRTQTIPETDRIWLSLGAGYQYSDNLSFDAGFTYIIAKDAPMTETLEVNEKPLANITGETTGNVWLVGVQANYRF